MKRLRFLCLILVLAWVAASVDLAEAAEKRANPARARAHATPRKLEDIHIEGEIPVPQVLFITARDQRRVVDFQHRRYLKTSRVIGQETVLPSRVAIARKPEPKP